MNLTKQQKRRLAHEARKLAMECVENGPRMTARDWCGCAAGVVVRRSGVVPPNTVEHKQLASYLDELPGLYFVLTAATDMRVYDRDRTAVVFPLLAVADELESE